MIITEPGVHYDMPAETYHSDPVEGGSLSSTGARKLLAPSCPAKFKHWLDNGDDHSKAFDYGTAAHKYVLGTGPEIVEVDAPDWRTKAAKETAVEARAQGKVPLLTKTHNQVRDMAKQLGEHPLAGRLFTPGRGHAEVALFWHARPDPNPVWLRARLDWVPKKVEGRRLIITDYKTCASGDRDSISKAIHRYGYHQQAPWYLDGVKAVLREDATFLFVFQEKDPPYVVTVAQLDHDALRIGRARNRHAVRLYRECRDSGVWPGYSDTVELISLPRWAEIEDMEDIL